jgi:hypothetical protein
MPNWLKGLLTIIICTAVPAGILSVILAANGQFVAQDWAVITAAFVGFAYGLEAGILTIYDLSSPVGWFAILIDLTWSLPNTVWGFVVGNILFSFFGNPSKADSTGAHWIVYQPRSSGGFGTSLLQTHGTINLGGAGQHEKMHLLQARLFGPLYLPIFGISYIVTSLLQLLWSATLGWILVVAKVRQHVALQPPARSAVQGLFGWIYYATPLELWAYAAGNP